MKIRQLITLAVVSLVVITLVGPMGAQAGSQATGCADANWPVLQPSDPAYLDAVELARTLADHGFMVMCIAPSKWTGMFEGQKGAAVYRTDRGGFDALFLPKPQNFDRLQIVERQESGEYCTPSPGVRRRGPQITSRVLILSFSSSTRIG